MLKSCISCNGTWHCCRLKYGEYDMQFMYRWLVICKNHTHISFLALLTHSQQITV